MIYNEKKKNFYVESESDKEWVNRAWDAFYREVYTKGDDTIKKLFKDWGIANEGTRWFIRYADYFLKRNPKVKKEQDLRNKLARITTDYYKKIDKVKGGK